MKKLLCFTNSENLSESNNEFFIEMPVDEFLPFKVGDEVLVTCEKEDFYNNLEITKIEWQVYDDHYAMIVSGKL